MYKLFKYALLDVLAIFYNTHTIDIIEISYVAACFLEICTIVLSKLEDQCFKNPDMP